MEWVKCNQKQIQGLINERNEYRQLLEQCLVAINDIPDRPVQSSDPRGDNTYALAFRIEQAFRKYR